MYNDMFPPWQCHAEETDYPKHPLCSSFSSFLLFLKPWQLLIFLLSIILPFAEYHVAGIKQHVVFSDWLLSLSNIHLSFLHVFSWLESFLNHWIILHYMDVSQFVYPFTFQRTSSILSFFWNYEQSCCTHLSSGFHV